MCMALRWNIMFRLIFCSRLSLRCLRFFFISFRVYTHETWHIFGNYVYPSMARNSPSKRFLLLPTSQPSQRACVCVCERKYFKFAHTHAPCVQLEIYQAYEKHFASFPNCLLALRLSYSVDSCFFLLFAF